jgi:hypothetical protein
MCHLFNWDISNDGECRLKQTLVAAKQSAQQKPGRQLTGAAQMRDEGQGAICFASTLSDDLDVGSFTGVARQALSFVRRQPGVSGQPRRRRDPNGAPPADSAASSAPRADWHPDHDAR